MQVVEIWRFTGKINPAALRGRKRTCDPGGIRTHDPQLRRLLLYPAELLDPKNGAKVAESSQLCNPLRRFLFMAILQALFPAFSANARNHAISDSRRLCDLWPTTDKRKQMPATKPPDSIRQASATDTNLFH